MDTRPRIEEFLTLEATMQQLLDQLQQLREETESYSAARESLTVTVDRIVVLTEQFGSVAGQVQDVVRALREIGTPELLSRHDSLQEQLNDLLGTLDVLQEHSTSSRQELSTQSTTIVQKAGTLEAAVDQLQEHVLASEQVLEKKIRNLQIMMIVLTIVGVGAILAVLLLV